MSALKVLTLHQPYASFVALKVKTIETRGQATNVRGRIAIHAASVRPSKITTFGPYSEERDACDYSLLRAEPFVTEETGAEWVLWSEPGWMPLPFGLTLYHESNREGLMWGRYIDDQLPYGDYQPGRFAWLIDDIEPLDTPVPFKGGQGWSKSWTPAGLSGSKGEQE